MPKKNTTRYIFVIGGVMSGIGKGISSSSIGLLLSSRDYKINLMKIDPYLNVDAGTMNPIEHGEVFVLDSGLECDQDMGNYERFTNKNYTNDDYLTSGMLYKSVIEKERAFGYKGRCVEAIPHLVDEAYQRIVRSATKSKADIQIVEIGGTIGDYQNQIYLEAAKSFQVNYPDEVAFILVTYSPMPSILGDIKTRPTQRAIRDLNAFGIRPDVVIARSEKDLDKKHKEKIARSSNIDAGIVISAPNLESIYEVPLSLREEGVDNLLIDILGLKKKRQNKEINRWKKFVSSQKGKKKTVKIAVIGKYLGNTEKFTDAYISIVDALKSTGISLGVKVEIDWFNSKYLESAKHSSVIKQISSYNGILVPGGFGQSGVKGKLKIIKYARENKIPYFGICYGMQLATIEFARNVLGIKNATSEELNENAKDKVIHIMKEQRDNVKNKDYGGTMRLGAYRASVKDNTLLRKLYKKQYIIERHRHRYEFNNAYVKRFENKGLIMSAYSPDKSIVEAFSLNQNIHPFFIGTQFHPEFLARPINPHPLFVGFIKAAISKK